MTGKLILKDGSEYFDQSFGREKPMTGEVVFATGMVGYPESMTDPSYAGQILVLTYPLIGNYGIPENGVEQRDGHTGLSSFFESSRIHVRGLVISRLSEHYSHWSALNSLAAWMKKYDIPGLHGVDTRE